MNLRWISLGLVLSCAGPGPYGYARTYVPNAGEEAAARGAKPLDESMLAESARFADVPLTMFGVVEKRGLASTKGHTFVTLSLRRLDERNVCASGNDERSCRVTVSDARFGDIPAVLELAPEDDAGDHAVGPGSLLRVVGVLGSDYDAVGGGAILHGTWYRHWPRGTYVTRAAAKELRQ